jgi:hypothetical protein
MPWQEVKFTTSEYGLDKYVHDMLNRKNYSRVDNPTPGLYYSSTYDKDGAHYTWYEWEAPGGRFTKLRLGFWELYRFAHKEDDCRAAFLGPEYDAFIEAWADA